MSEQPNAHLDVSAGMRPKARKPASKIDLAAGLIAKKKSVPKIDLAAGLIPRDESAAPGRSTTGGFVSGPRRAAPSAPVADSSLTGAGHPGNQHAPAQAAPPPKPINPLRDVVHRAATVKDDSAVGAPQEPMHVLAVDGTPQGTWQPGAPPAEAVQGEFAAQKQEMPQANREPVQEPSQPLRGREPQPAPAPPPVYAAARREPVPVPPVYPAARREPVAPPPVQPWESAASQRDSMQYEIASPDSGSFERNDPQYNAATRMTGLRNLIQTLGMKNPPQPPDAGAPSSQAVQPPEPVQPRPVYPRTPPPMPQQPAWRNPPTGSPTLVTAPPEFLPPKPMVEKEENEHSSTHNNTRRDRRDTYDDVEILPSWRGQYKRK